MSEVSYKYRIYPNKTQIQIIEQTFGNCRFVYNHYLDERINEYTNNGNTLNYYDNMNDLKNLKKQYEWLKLSDSTAYQNCLKNLQNAYQKFFKEHSGFPKFKSKKTHKFSYKTTNNNNAIRILDNSHIQLPKLKSIKIKYSRLIKGRILSATVSKNSSGKYYMSLCCTDVDILPKEKTGAVVGIDLGLKNFAITSDGVKIDNPKYYAKSQKKLAKLQRKLSRKTRGSKNYEKARIKVAKCNEHISNQRNDFLQKLSTQIINDYDIISLETLKVKNMLKNHKLAKSISDVGWSGFVRMLSYKSSWYDKQLVQINTFFPSSQTCNCCGEKFPITKDLSVREWICPNCGNINDRDINAAKNILEEGLKLLTI